MRSKRFILCTGSLRKYLPLANFVSGIQHLSLDIALSPSKLLNILPSLHRKTIAVIGGSHSAVLVLRNIATLVLNGIAEINVRWFVRHKLRYAEYENEGMWLSTTLVSRVRLRGGHDATSKPTPLLISSRGSCMSKTWKNRLTPNIFQE
jgi:hypothetical protein